MTEEMIRDRLIVGIKDRSLSEKLQLDPDLSLEKAKKMVRQREAVQEQQTQLKGAEGGSIDEVQHSFKHTVARKKPQMARSNNTQGRCSRCGNDYHPRSRCPARNATCHRCQKIGHYSTQCFSKTVSEVVPGDHDVDTVFLGTMTSDSEESAWFTKIQLYGQETRFKLDTGAEVSAISEKTYQQLRKPTLTLPGKVLCGPSRIPLKVLGQFKGKLR